MGTSLETRLARDGGRFAKESFNAGPAVGNDTRRTGSQIFGRLIDFVSEKANGRSRCKHALGTQRANKTRTGTQISIAYKVRNERIATGTLC